MRNPNAEDSFVVAGNRPWARIVFDQIISKYPGRWHFVGDPPQLNLEWLLEVNPRYIFFLHWSSKVPDAVLGKYECVCFHMTDVPYGRGGSPLQNLILRGHHRTKLTALRMTHAFDAGPVYLKEELCLEGAAEEIYLRSCRLAAEMIGRILTERPTPVEQTGDVVEFRRRKPEQSEISGIASLQALHDFVRMLDAEGYPRAFLVANGFRFEFSRAAFQGNRIVADVTVTPAGEGKQ